MTHTAILDRELGAGAWGAIFSEENLWYKKLRARAQKSRPDTSEKRCIN